MRANTLDLHGLPIDQRPALPWRRRVKAIVFFILFNLGCFMVNATQMIFLLPLKLLPFNWSKRMFDEGIRYTKSAFGCLLILMCQWFAPTSLSITFESEGKGRFNAHDIERMVVRGPSGEFVSLNLPIKFVLIANHQMYADWWYAWCLTYFIGPRGVHRNVYITLKKSLKWVPIVGWGMQLYGFIFLARSWVADRVQLATHLSALAGRAEEEDNPLCFILYPEGTLVSKDTRPISKKFADKMGISDTTNILLPRSTGLHYSLRSLAPRIPDLHLIDLTVVYPGIPSLGFGQTYYTLRSIFMDGVPPPTIHVHIRMFNVKTEVPIGGTFGSKLLPDNMRSPRAEEIEIPDTEKEQFDRWLRDLWQDKDDSMTKFSETGSFGAKMALDKPVKIPLELRRRREVLDAFCFFLPAGAIYLWGKLQQRRLEEGI